jgi:hypothetical protein
LVSLVFELEAVAFDDLLPEFEREYGLSYLDRNNYVEAAVCKIGRDSMRLERGMRRPATSEDLTSKKEDYFGWTLEVEMTRYYEVP